MTKSVTNVFYMFLRLLSVLVMVLTIKYTYLSICQKSAVCPHIYLEPEFEISPNLYFTRQVSLKHFLDHHRLVKKSCEQ